MFPRLRIAWPAAACRPGSPPTQQQPCHAPLTSHWPGREAPPAPQMPARGGTVHSDPPKSGSQEPLDFPEGFRSSVRL